MPGLFPILAILVAVAHVAFVLFATLGGLLVVRRPKIAWLHLPAMLWAIWIEVSGGICPLTPLENLLRERGGMAGYETGFIEHYLFAALYPEGLTREVQLALAALLTAVNVAVYGRILLRRRR